MLCFRVTTLFAISNDRSLSSLQTPISNKVLRNGRKPVMPNVPRGNSTHCSQRMVIRTFHCLAPSGSSLKKALWCSQAASPAYIAFA